MTTYNVSIDSLNQQIRIALDRFDLDEVQQLLARALPQANADTFFLAAHVTTDDAERRAMLEQALEHNPHHWMAQLELKRRYGVADVAATTPVADVQAEQQRNATTAAQREQERQNRVAAMQRQAAKAAEQRAQYTVTTHSGGQGEADATAEQRVLPAPVVHSKVVQQMAKSQPGEPVTAVTINGVHYLYRPIKPFLIAGFIAGLIGSIINMADPNQMSLSLLLLAYITSGLVAGLASGALAQSRVSLIILLLAPLPAMFAFGAFQDRLGGHVIHPRFAMMYCAGLLTSTVVAHVLALQSKKLVDDRGDIQQRKGTRWHATWSAAVTGAVIMLLVVMIRPPAHSSIDPQVFMSVVIAFIGYGILGLISGAAMRKQWWRKPTHGFWLTWLGFMVGLGMLAPAMWIWSFVGLGNLLEGTNTPKLSSWGVVAFIVVFCCSLLYYLTSKKQRTVLITGQPKQQALQRRAPKQQTPEQQAQAQAVMGVFGLIVLALGAAFLQGAPERAKRRQAEQEAQQRRQRQLYEQQVRAQQIQQQQARAQQIQQQQTRAQQVQQQQAQAQQAREQQARELAENLQKQFDEEKRRQDWERESHIARLNREEQKRRHEQFLKEHRGPYDP